MAVYDWAVVGAGPAGILAVAKLLDAGIHEKNIVWLDPEFKVGDFGSKWSEVPSNTVVKLFIDFFKDIKCLDFSMLQSPLFQLDPHSTCKLSYMAEPLQFYSDLLREKVSGLTETMTNLALKNRCWQISTESQNVQANNVVLATGAEPCQAPIEHTIETIELDIALNPSKLKEVVQQNDHIAVFGSSHSAILVLKNLVDLAVSEISNFYIEPCRYALAMPEGWTLFDNTGLKGNAALWAKDNIDGILPSNLKRYFSNNQNIERYLPSCTKVISATGFKARNNFTIEGLDTHQYHPQTGIIAPGLFGLGIAYPETKLDPLGGVEQQVGLWKFVNYLNRVLPIWLKYST